MQETTIPGKGLVSQILKEIKDYPSATIPLSDNVSHSQYEKVNIIKTHQNKGFLMSLPEGMVDDRMFYDIITPLVDTGVKNTDIDTKNVEPVSLTRNFVAQQILLKPELNLYFRSTDEDTRINNIVEVFTDEGNVVVRKVKKEGIYKKVLLQNIMPLDQTAETLEDTDVIERDFKSQAGLKKMKEWFPDQVDALIKSFKTSGSTGSPMFEIFYRFGDIKGSDFYEFVESENKIDDEYIPALVVLGRVKLKTDQNVDKISVDTLQNGDGFILFVEELKPEKVKVARNYNITRYKPYEEAHFGAYKGRWLREGYREICIQNQNRANELGNQIRIGMKLSLKHILWSRDKRVAGKNILSAIKDGQIIQAEDLQVLNLSENKNLAAYSEEWNRNIQNAREKCQAFEISLGDKTKGDPSATEVNIQNMNNANFYRFKRQKLGIFFRNVYNRWVLSELISYLTPEHELEITGDPSYIDTYLDVLISGWYVRNLVNFPPHSPEMAEMLKEDMKAKMLKDNNFYQKVPEAFYKEAEIILDFVITDESSNKQTKVTNGLAMLNYITNPVIMQDPTGRDIVTEIANDLGFKVKKSPPIQMQPQPAGATPNNGKIPSAVPGTPQEQTSNNQSL